MNDCLSVSRVSKLSIVEKFVRLTSAMRPTFVLEYRLWKQGYSILAGADEAGRGAWAGPVVAAAVAARARDVPKLRALPLWSKVHDSKQLTPILREAIFVEVVPCLVYGVGVVSSGDIDRLGIAEANKLAVHKALMQLPLNPSYAIIDYLPGFDASWKRTPVQSIVRGDSRSLLIALASIIAKVTRDRLMRQYDSRYPGYAFGAHKGYGTFAHAAALRRLGTCPIHRRSYRPVAAFVGK